MSIQVPNVMKQAIFLYSEVPNNFTAYFFTYVGFFGRNLCPRQFVNILWDGRVNTIDFVHLFWRWDKNESTFWDLDAFSSIFPNYLHRFF